MYGELKSIDIWKSELQKREKTREKNHAKRRIIEMFTVVATDLLQRIITETEKPTKETETKLDSIIGELNALRTYFNTEMATIGKRFDCVAPSIDEKWNNTRM